MRLPLECTAWAGVLPAENSQSDISKLAKYNGVQPKPVQPWGKICMRASQNIPNVQPYGENVHACLAK